MDAQSSSKKKKRRLSSEPQPSTSSATSVSHSNKRLTGAFSMSEKIMVYNVFLFVSNLLYAEQAKKQDSPLDGQIKVNKKECVTKAAEALGIGKSSVFRILKERKENDNGFNPPKKRGPKHSFKDKFDEFTFAAIRRKVHAFFYDNTAPTVAKIEKEGLDSVNIQEILLQMRRDRMGLIQTPDQLRFSYQAIIEGAKRLDHDWMESTLEESIYLEVADSEEAPPPPPPRGESLSRPPARPLPAIPTSTSLGELKYSGYAQESDGSSSTPPTPPARPSPSLTPVSSADDEEEEVANASPDSGTSVSGGTAVRRRRTRELAERVSVMKRRARDAERWHALKRSLYKPLTITIGVFLASILIYSYVKH